MSNILPNFTEKPQRKFRRNPGKSKSKPNKPISNPNKTKKTQIQFSSDISKPNSQLSKPTMIANTRLTTQLGIFNMGKVSKTVSRGPLRTSNQSTHFPPAQPIDDILNNSIILRILNEPSTSRCMNDQEHSMMETSRSVSPELETDSPKQLRMNVGNSFCLQQDINKRKPGDNVSQLPMDTNESTSECQIPYEELEHNVLDFLKPADFFNAGDSLKRIKKDLAETLKNNMPSVLYEEILVRHNAAYQEKLIANQKKPLQTSHLENQSDPINNSRVPELSRNQDNVNSENAYSEWTALMGDFSSQDRDYTTLPPIDKTSNRSRKEISEMMEYLAELDVSTKQNSEISKPPPYNDTPSPFKLYRQKMF